MKDGIEKKVCEQ